MQAQLYIIGEQRQRWSSVELQAFYHIFIKIKKTVTYLRLYAAAAERVRRNVSVRRSEGNHKSDQKCHLVI